MTGRNQTWRNRIVGHGEESPDQLCANPRNWRIHEIAQQQAVSGSLSELGVIKSITVNRRTGFVVDGHLRVTLALRSHQPTIPVEYVDLDDAEEAKALAYLDPTAAMAGSDRELLGSLLREIQTDDAALMQMLSQMAEDAGVIPPDFDPVGIDEQGRLDEKAKVTCPECGHEFAP